MYYVQIYGPRTTGFFGSDSLTIESPASVAIDESGNLVIEEAAREERVVDNTGRRIKARKARTVTYPRGAWDKIVVGEIERPKLRFQVDADFPGEAPEGVWPESWRDLLSAMGVARVTGSIGTTSETIIEGRGRQTFKAFRHPSQRSLFYVEEI